MVYYITLYFIKTLLISHNILTISHYLHIIESVISMQGINLDKSIRYLSASLRFFKENEHHVSRCCQEDVLVLVYDGVLRFSENGEQKEISAGQYYIQRHGIYQGGEIASDSPKYLYIHFLTDEWTEVGKILPKSGVFEYSSLKNAIDEMNRLSHSDAPYIAKAGQFYSILTSLYTKKSVPAIADKISDFIIENCCKEITLTMLCHEFHFSKNHIINIFRKSYGITPMAYLQRQRLQKSEYLIEMTSDTIESISEACGFNNYSNFYKLFVHKNNISPEKWREKKRLAI